MREKVRVQNAMDQVRQVLASPQDEKTQSPAPRGIIIKAERGTATDAPVRKCRLRVLRPTAACVKKLLRKVTQERI